MTIDVPTTDFYCDFVLNKKVAVDIVKETETVLAFYHTEPSWSLHIVIVPKKHIANLIELADMQLLTEIFDVAKEIIVDKELEKSNFKIVTNGGTFQDSKHLHFHLLSGSPLR